MVDNKSNKFSDFLARNEAKATPERLSQMNQARKFMEILHTEYFGSTTQKESTDTKEKS